MAEDIYTSPRSQTPKATGAPSAVALTAAILLIGSTAVYLAITSDIGLVIPLALNAVLSMSLVVWAYKISNKVQERLDREHYKQWLDENEKWVTGVVIPTIRELTSIKLSLKDALTLVYEGKLHTKLGAPYSPGYVHRLLFFVDAEGTPYVRLYRCVDKNLVQASPFEAIAVQPYRQPSLLRRIFGRKKS